MGIRLPVCGNLLLAELLVQCAIKNVGHALGIPRPAVFVSVLHLCCGGFIEEEHQESGYNW